MLTGRSFSGAEAMRRGLIDYCFSQDDLDPGVDALCDDILAGAPITVRTSKRMINRILEMDAAGAVMDRDSQAELDALSMEAHTSEDVREGLTAFFERRKPDFRGR